MAGLTLLEVMLACFIVTSSTLGILWLLMQQRVTLDQMQTRVVAIQLLSDVANQSKQPLCAETRNKTMSGWEKITENLLPHYRMTVRCVKTGCTICIKNTIHQEKALCASIVIADSPSLKCY